MVLKETIYIYTVQVHLTKTPKFIDNSIITLVISRQSILNVMYNYITIQMINEAKLV